MKPITRVKRMIRKQLTSKECWELKEFIREEAYRKKREEKIASIKALGVGGKVIVQGGSTETVRLRIACLEGTIIRFGPKRVSVDLPHPTRPGKWYIPYHNLYPATEENIKREQKLMGHAKIALPVLGKINKIAREMGVG